MRGLKRTRNLAKWFAVALLACGPAWANGPDGADGIVPGGTGGNGGTDQTVSTTPAALQGVGGTGGAGGAGVNGTGPGDSGGAGGAGGSGGVGVDVTVGGTFTSTGASAGGAGGSGAAGGRGGDSANSNGGSGGAGGTGGAGATGVVFDASGATVDISTTGSIAGGNGGAGGRGGDGSAGGAGAIIGPDGGNGGAGGTGGAGRVGITGASLTITNQGSITGGAGGIGGIGGTGGAAGTAPGPSGNPGSDGATGTNGVGAAAIQGSGLTITNSGSITGGLGGDGTTRANAITFTGGTNSLELHAGSTITGNVVVTGGSGTLILGGTTNASFDVSKIGTQYQNFGAFQKTGTSTWTMTGSNAGPTAWTVTGGLLAFSAASNFGTGSITLNGGGLQWATGNTTDISGRLAAIGANGATFDTNGNDVTFASALSGGALTKAGAGTLTLTGTNTYTGGTTVNAGTLAIGRTNALATTGALTVGANGTFDINGFNQTIGSLSGSGTVTNGDSVSATLTVGGSSSTFSGVIQDGTHATALTKTGSGTLTLSGNNSYSGGTSLNQGTLAVGSNTALGTGTLTAASGTTLQTTTAVSLANAMTLNATLTVDTGSNAATLSGTIGGGGALTKAGSGTLTLTGANTYTGATIVGFGTLAVNGSLTSSVSVTTDSTLGGTGSITGSVTVDGTIAPGNSIGTLNITGTYRQDAGSFYTVDANSAGQSDKIAVTGNAVLNGGTVNVQAQNGVYQRNTSYTILTATGGVTGTYAGATSNLAFLTPSLSYSASAVTLTLLSTANSFRNGAQTSNQAAVGTVLDNASSTATGDFNTVLNALYNLSTAQGPAALDAIGGQNYSGFSSLAMQGSQLFMDSFQIQVGAGGGGGASLPGGTTYQALKVGTADACDTACDVEPLWGAWGGGMGAFGTVAGDSNGHGLTYNLGGFIAGLDRKFAPGFRAGVAAGFNAATLYTQGMPGTGTSNTLQFALYGEYAPGPFYVDALAGYGHSDNRMNRPIVIPGLPFRMAQGYTTANTFFGQLEAGYKIAVAPSFGGFVTPFARLQASTSTQAGFSETGADSLNLTVAQQTTNSLRTVLGAQLGAGIDAPWHEKLDLVFRLGWSHEYADQTRPVTAAFAGAPALSFTTFGAQAPRNGVVLGLGANTQLAERTSLYFRYDGDLAGANTNHVLNAGVRYVW